MIHTDLAAGKWQLLTLVEQLANVGSEVGRTIQWRDKNREFSQSASFRALELLDLTIGDPKNISSLREILRVRELFCDYMFGENQYGSTDTLWEKYFLAFAALVNNKKFRISS